MGFYAQHRSTLLYFGRFKMIVIAGGDWAHGELLVKQGGEGTLGTRVGTDMDEVMRIE